MESLFHDDFKDQVKFPPLPQGKKLVRDWNLRSAFEGYTREFYEFCQSCNAETVHREYPVTGGMVGCVNKICIDIEHTKRKAGC